MKDIIVIYHADCTDGAGAAYAAWTVLGETAEYIPAHYGNEPPDVTGKAVYILDFSYPRAVLLDMKTKAKSLLVLDHHKTARTDLEGLDFAVFDMDRSGCMMAWDHFVGGLPPKALVFIQDRDLWQFKFPETRDFCAGLRATMEDFRDIHYLCTDDMIELGAALNAEFDRDLDTLEKRAHTFMVYADGGKRLGLAVNAPAKYASELGNRLAKRAKTACLVYSYDGSRKEWQYSLRSTDEGLDVSSIAKRYRGGGHRNAAGFARKVTPDFDEWVL